MRCRAIVGDAYRRNSIARIERNARRLDDVSRRHQRSVAVPALVSAGVHRLTHPLGHPHECLRRRRRRLRDNDRLSLIASLEDARVQRDLSEKRQLQRQCESLTAA
jgi:hypothetical protein